MNIFSTIYILGKWLNCFVSIKEDSLKEQEASYWASHHYFLICIRFVFVVFVDSWRRIQDKKKDDDWRINTAYKQKKSYCFRYHLIDILYGTRRDHKINLVVYIYRKTAIREILRIRANTSDDLGILLYILRLGKSSCNIFRRNGSTFPVLCNLDTFYIVGIYIYIKQQFLLR
jgi:hypothetical protein